MGRANRRIHTCSRNVWTNYLISIFSSKNRYDHVKEWIGLFIFCYFLMTSSDVSCRLMTCDDVKWHQTTLVVVWWHDDVKWHQTTLVVVWWRWISHDITWYHLTSHNDFFFFFKLSLMFIDVCWRLELLRSFVEIYFCLHYLYLSVSRFDWR